MALLHLIGACPAAILALLPTGTCPLCVTGNVGVLSGIGIPFIVNDRVRSPMVIVFLLTTIGCVGFVTMKRRAIAPLAVVIVGSLAIIAGRLVWNLPALAYLGAAALAVGSMWSITWRPRQAALRFDA